KKTWSSPDRSSNRRDCGLIPARWRALAWHAGDRRCPAAAQASASQARPEGIRAARQPEKAHASRVKVRDIRRADNRQQPQRESPYKERLTCVRAGVQERDLRPVKEQ